MIREIQHKRRMILVLLFILLPVFIGSLWLVIQMEFYDYVPKTKKTFVLYLCVICTPMFAIWCYGAHKKELIMKLSLHQTAINFDTFNGPTLIPINKVEFITFDTDREVCMFNMTNKIPLENHNIIELNVSNYDISFDSFVSLIQEHYSQLDIK